MISGANLSSEAAIKAFSLAAAANSVATRSNRLNRCSFFGGEYHNLFDPEQAMFGSMLKLLVGNQLGHPCVLFLVLLLYRLFYDVEILEMHEGRRIHSSWIVSESDDDTHYV